MNLLQREKWSPINSKTVILEIFFYNYKFFFSIRATQNIDANLHIIKFNVLKLVSMIDVLVFQLNYPQ